MPLDSKIVYKVLVAAIVSLCFNGSGDVSAKAWSVDTASTAVLEYQLRRLEISDYNIITYHFNGVNTGRFYLPDSIAIAEYWVDRQLHFICYFFAPDSFQKKRCFIVDGSVSKNHYNTSNVNIFRVKKSEDFAHKTILKDVDGDGDMDSFIVSKSLSRTGRVPSSDSGELKLEILFMLDEKRTLHMMHEGTDLFTEVNNYDLYFQNALLFEEITELMYLFSPFSGRISGRRG